MSETRPQKRKRQGALRSSEADLKVIVGEDENHEVFWHYSTTLASRSGYVDTLLSTGLPTINDSDLEKEGYKQIAFPDIEPEQWERMMGFLEDDPYSMTVEDAMELAALYDKYEFKAGIKICDGVLMEKGLMFDFNDSDHDKLLDNLGKMVYTPFSKVDGYVDVIELSEKMNLKKTFYWGRAWLHFLFDALIFDDLLPAEGTSRDFPLTARHIAQLIPTFTRDAEMPEFPEDWENALDFEEFTKQYNGSGEEIGFGLMVMLFEITTAPDSIEITNPLFPDWFITKCKELYGAGNFALNNLKGIRVIGPDSTSGIYFFQGDCSFVNQRNSDLWFHKLEKWALTKGVEQTPMFVNPKSAFAILPPKTGWVDFDSGSKAKLKLEYVWK